MYFHFSLIQAQIDSLRVTWNYWNRVGVFSFRLSIWKRFCPFPSPLRVNISPLAADHSKALTQDSCFPGRWWGQLSLQAVLQGVWKQLPRRHQCQAPPEDTHSDLFLSRIDTQTLQAQLPLPAASQPWTLPYFSAPLQQFSKSIFSGHGLHTLRPSLHTRGCFSQAYLVGSLHSPMSELC